MLYKVQQHCDVNLSKKRKFTTEGGMSSQDEKIKKYIYKQISTLERQKYWQWNENNCNEKKYILL